MAAAAPCLGGLGARRGCAGGQGGGGSEGESEQAIVEGWKPLVMLPAVRTGDPANLLLRCGLPAVAGEGAVVEQKREGP